MVCSHHAVRGEHINVGHGGGTYQCNDISLAQIVQQRLRSLFRSLPDEEGDIGQELSELGYAQAEEGPNEVLMLKVLGFVHEPADSFAEDGAFAVGFECECEYEYHA
jgi:hypothetical protein